MKRLFGVWLCLLSGVSVALTLSEPLPPPEAKADGRGAAIEKLVPQYGADYEKDPFLANEVTLFRRWQWEKMYAALHKKATERPQYAPLYRLQIEAYLVTQAYREALAQADQLLRLDPRDSHALAMSALAAQALGEETIVKERLSALQQISPAAARDMERIFSRVESNFSSKPSSNIHNAPEAIVVFGQTPQPDGTPSAGLLSRLQTTREWANRFPKASIILSGGDVNTPFIEANVMRDWLQEQGVAVSRLYTDPLARDTYGNAVGVLPILQKQNVKNAVLVATERHLPRALSTLEAYTERLGAGITWHGAGGGVPASRRDLLREKQYAFINTARAAGLFTWSDFKKYRDAH